VSLFPPTYKDRPNATAPTSWNCWRPKPGFLRFPGGNYLEGPDYENRFNWKATIGPLEQRPTHLSPWRYRSSDGLGLLEFLHWAEDLNAEPILGLYAGLHIDKGANILRGRTPPHVQTPSTRSVRAEARATWGASPDGHPRPSLRYVKSATRTG
jgi:alpha-N-arabinofuranosidase